MQTAHTKHCVTHSFDALQRNMLTQPQQSELKQWRIAYFCAVLSAHCSKAVCAEVDAAARVSHRSLLSGTHELAGTQPSNMLQCGNRM